MTTLTFYAPTRFARYVQNLVKKYDGRFVHNPLDMFQGDSQFKISFEDIVNCNKFTARYYILNQPFV